MALRYFRHAALILLSALLAVPVSAAPTLEQQVDSMRARAERAVSLGRWDAAFAWIAEARKRIRVARRDSLSTTSTRPSNPAHEQEQRKLREWLAGQDRLVQSGKKTREQVVRELKAKQSVLYKKYGNRPAPAKTPASATARYDLLQASLDDTLADYYQRRGDTQNSREYRRTALVTRLHVFEAQAKLPQATAVAEKLLKAVPQEPEAYSAAATYFQSHGQTRRAGEIWAQGISALERGTAQVRPKGSGKHRTRSKNQYLAHFHRQQAFCFSKLGKTAEAKAAMARAVKLEADAGSPHK